MKGKIMIIIAASIVIISALLVIAIYIYNRVKKFEKIIEKKTQLKSLGALPFNERSNNLMIENTPKANMMEYIRNLRNNILQFSDKKSILITSYSSGEGKSWVANNLSVALARINKRVLLIDADLRKKSDKSETFYIEKEEGIFDFLKDMTESDSENLDKAKKYIAGTQIPNLHILSNGTISDDQEDLISSKKMKQLLKLLKKMYDIIILDGSICVDNIELSTIVDGSIFVVDNKKIDIEQIKEEKDLFWDVGSEILGFVLNKINVRSGKYYGKENKCNYGMYIETRKREEIQHSITVEEIVESVKMSIEDGQENKFDEMYNEIRGKVLVDDFIYDIETSFNDKLEDIKKSSKEYFETLIENLKENKQNLDDVIITNNYSRNIEEEFHRDIINKMLIEFGKLNNEINVLKSRQATIEKNDQIHSEKIDEISQKISNINYDEDFKNLTNMIDNKNYNENFENLAHMIDNKNYNENFENLANLIGNINFNKNFEEINRNVSNINFDKNFEEINRNVSNINFDKNFEEINKNISNINFDKNFEEVNDNINNKNYNRDFQEIARMISCKNYNKDFQEIARMINCKNYNKDFQEISKLINNMNYEENFKEIIKKLNDIKYNKEENNENESLNNDVQKNSNIINLGQFFIENRKNDTEVFSTDETISYEDLEKMAFCVIDLDEGSSIDKTYIMKEKN